MTRPTSYETWQRCITVDCGIALSEEFCRERLEALADPRDPHTRRFRDLYGEEHLRMVQGWFERALDESRGGRDEPPGTR